MVDGFLPMNNRIVSRSLLVSESDRSHGVLVVTHAAYRPLYGLGCFYFRELDP